MSEEIGPGHPLFNAALEEALHTHDVFLDWFAELSERNENYEGLERHLRIEARVAAIIGVMQAVTTLLDEAGRTNVVALAKSIKEKYVTMLDPKRYT